MEIFCCASRPFEGITSFALFRLCQSYVNLTTAFISRACHMQACTLCHLLCVATVLVACVGATRTLQGMLCSGRYVSSKAYLFSSRVMTEHLVVITAKEQVLFRLHVSLQLLARCVGAYIIVLLVAADYADWVSLALIADSNELANCPYGYICACNSVGIQSTSCPTTASGQ